MKTLLYMFFIMFASCTSPEISIEKRVYQVNGDAINIYIIDSCEYIGRISGDASFLTHKGNCKCCKR